LVSTTSILQHFPPVNFLGQEMTFSTQKGKKNTIKEIKPAGKKKKINKKMISTKS
jgi:hypothetical protein